MKKKRLLAACLALALLPLLSSCSMISDYTLDLRSKLVGIPFTVSTYRRSTRSRVSQSTLRPTSR